MAPVKPIEQLRKLCTNAVDRMLSSTLVQGVCTCSADKSESPHNITWKRAEECETVNAVRKHLQEILLPLHRQELLDELLTRNGEHVVAHFGALQTLLDRHTKTVLIASDPYMHRNAMLNDIGMYAQSLEELIITGLWLRVEEVTVLSKVLEKIPNLTRFTAHFECSFGTLAPNLAKYCIRLKHLDISRGCMPQPEEIEKLCYLNQESTEKDHYSLSRLRGRQRAQLCNTLESFSVGSEVGAQTPAAVSALSIAVAACPKLSNLRICPFWADALLIVVDDRRKHPEEGQQDTFPNLYHLCDTRADPERLKLLARVCPNLRNFTLFSAQRETLQKLHIMGKVTRVSIGSVQWTGFQDYLNEHGSKLERMRLSGGPRCYAEMQLTRGHVDLCVIAKQCPSLVQLICGDVVLRWFQNGIPPPMQANTISDPPPPLIYRAPSHKFYSLSKVKMWGCDLSAQVIVDFLAACPVIEEVIMFTCGTLADDDIRWLVTQGHLSRLRVLCFKVAKQLTAKGAQTLVDGCPHLEWLGCLADWTGMTSQGLRSITNHVKRNNLNVTLSDYNQPSVIVPETW